MLVKLNLTVHLKSCLLKYSSTVMYGAWFVVYLPSTAASIIICLKQLGFFLGLELLQVPCAILGDHPSSGSNPWILLDLQILGETQFSGAPEKNISSLAANPSHPPQGSFPMESHTPCNLTS